MTKARKNKGEILLTALAGCLIYAVSSGIRVNYGIMLTAISNNSGVSYSSVSFVLAVGQLVFGITQPIFGIVALKKSNTFVLGMGAVMMAIGLISVPFCKTLFLLLLFLGILVPSGTGALSFGIIMGAITPILGERNSAAVSGIVSASSGLGNIVFSPAIQNLLTGIGLSGTMFILSVPIIVLLPISFGLSRFKGEAMIKHGGTSLKGVFLNAIKNKNYIYLMLGFFSCGFHMAIIETHLYSQIVGYGFSEKIAALAFSVYGIATMLGSVLSGMLGSRFKMKWVLGGIYALRIVIIGVFLFVPKTVLTIYVCATLLGFTAASTVPPTSGLVGKIFGSAKLAALFGVVFFSHQIGSFFSAWFGGIIHNATGEYTIIWCASAALSLMAALVSFRIKEPKSTT